MTLDTEKIREAAARGGHADDDTEPDTEPEPEPEPEPEDEDEELDPEEDEEPEDDEPLKLRGAFDDLPPMPNDEVRRIVQAPIDVTYKRRDLNVIAKTIGAVGPNGEDPLKARSIAVLVSDYIRPRQFELQDIIALHRARAEELGLEFGGEAEGESEEDEVVP